MDALARLLSRDLLVVTKTDALRAKYWRHAIETWENPRQREDRTLDEIYKCVERRCIEDALAEHMGLVPNPKRHDKTDPDSYAWDLLDPETGLRVECKAMKRAWLSGYLKDFQTTWRNLHRMSVIFAAHVRDVGDGYEVYPELLVDPASFRPPLNPYDKSHTSRFMLKTDYKNRDGSPCEMWWYNDVRAARLGFARSRRSIAERHALSERAGYVDFPQELTVIDGESEERHVGPAAA